MISAKEYFEEYLTWKHRESSLRSAPYTYESYSKLQLEELIPEAEAGNPGAQQELGERYLFGLSDLRSDPQQAITWFEKAAEAGHPDAMHMLADIHRTDDFGLLDYDKYFELLVPAAQSGCWKAMFNYSCALYKGKDAYEGHGPESDKAEALILAGIKIIQLDCGAITRAEAVDVNGFVVVQLASDKIGAVSARIELPELFVRTVESCHF